jgi:hypothetical protein
MNLSRHLDLIDIYEQESDMSIPNKYRINETVYWSENTPSWRFIADFSTGEVKQNIGKMINITLGTYPKTSNSKNNYNVFGIQSLIGNISNGKYSCKKEMVKAWKEFCRSSNIKMLKNRKGESFLVDITENQIKYDDMMPAQTVGVSFTAVEVENCRNCVITSPPAAAVKAYQDCAAVNL